MIENALSLALHTKCKLVGSGRTDSGVHALEQVAHFSMEKEFDLKALLRSLNGLLPPDIRIHHIKEAPSDFHARYSAKGKVYRYHLNVGKIANPFTRLYSYHLPYPINFALLERAAPYFVGEHDFSSFVNEADRGSARKNPVRTIHRIEVCKKGEEIEIEFEGNGFLYKMVRNIVGTLLDISRGHIPLEDLPSIFEAKDRSRAGSCAPAHGLFLVKVFYS